MKRLCCVMLAVALFSGVTAWAGSAQEKLAELATQIDQMKPVLPEGASPEDQAKLTAEFELLKSFVKTKLIPTLSDPVWVQEVSKQNAQGMTLDQIKQLDKEWTEAEEELPIHQEKMSNPCAQEIKKTVQKVGALGEVFVMDNQGANVGQNALTSDFWQGDEAKWKKSFNQGKGGIDISARKYDRSSGVVDQKVSLPIINDQGEVIGAVCFGVKVDQLTTAVAAN